MIDLRFLQETVKVHKVYGLCLSLSAAEELDVCTAFKTGRVQ